MKAKHFYLLLCVLGTALPFGIPKSTRISEVVAIDCARSGSSPAR